MEKAYEKTTDGKWFTFKSTLTFDQQIEYVVENKSKDKIQVKRFIVTGPECTGKTTLSLALAKKLNASHTPEIAREYLNNLGRQYTQEDVLKMAKLQFNAILKTPVSENGIQICDTAMLEFKVWLSDKFESFDDFTEEAIDDLKDSYYLLCTPDIPYEDDPLREDPFRRNELFERYLAVLNDKKMLFTIIEGSFENRVNTAIKFIESQSKY